VNNQQYFSEKPSSHWSTKSHELEIRGHQVHLESSSGTFSPRGIDNGTAVLLKYAPPLPQEGNFLDLGCGWGALSVILGLESPGAKVWGVDVNPRAISTAELNLRKNSIVNATICLPSQVPETAAFDVIWSNPPIRIGKKQLHELLKKWLPRMKQNGSAWIVVAKKLGADSLETWLNNGGAGSLSVERFANSRGYRLFRAERRMP